MLKIETLNAPKPAGHYTQAIEQNGWLFVSGQLPVDPKTGERITGTIEDEAQQTLGNLLAIVEAGGGTRESIVKVTIYVSDIADWPRVNQVYAKFFEAHRPARSVVPCGLMHFQSRIEIDATAFIEPSK